MADLIIQLIALQHEHKELQQDHKTLDQDFHEVQKQLTSAKSSSVDPLKVLYSKRGNIHKVHVHVAQKVHRS